MIHGRQVSSAVYTCRFKSTFPPLLVGDHPRSAVSSRRRDTCSNTRSVQSKELSAKRERMKYTWGSQSRRDQLKAGDELEKRKKMKRARAVLLAWEELQEEERESRFSSMKEKVILQRELISRQDQLSSALLLCGRAKARQKKKKIEDRKVLTQGFVLVPKKSKTKNSAKQEDPEAAETHDPSPPTTASSANTSTPDDTAPPAVAQQPTITVTSTPIEDRMIYSFRPPKNRILQILGVSQEAFEQLEIEEMWLGLKAHASKEISRADAAVRKLREVSSPSVKECMKLYDEPITCDPYSGKSLLLSEKLKMTQLTFKDEKKHTVKSSKATTALKSWCAKQQLDARQKEVLLWANTGLGWFTGIECEEEKQANTEQEEQKKEVHKLSAGNLKPKLKKSVTIQAEPKIMDAEDDEVQWQPLSAGALEEHAGVSVRVAKKPLKSSLKRTTWRPSSCISDTISLNE